jgi:hypothetical protein
MTGCWRKDDPTASFTIGTRNSRTKKEHRQQHDLFPFQGCVGMAATDKTNSNSHIAGGKSRITGSLENLPLFTIRKFDEI